LFAAFFGGKETMIVSEGGRKTNRGKFEEGRLGTGAQRRG
jgi:hypothetical protein